MIQKTTAYQVDDQVFADIEAAQEHAIVKIIGPHMQPGSSGDEAAEIAKVLIDNAAHIIDILTTNVASKPKARAINGGTKKRTRKTEPQPTLPGVPGDPGK